MHPGNGKPDPNGSGFFSISYVTGLAPFRSAERIGFQNFRRNGACPWSDLPRDWQLFRSRGSRNAWGSARKLPVPGPISVPEPESGG